eukprot:tig00000498_g1576.t1
MVPLWLLAGAAVAVPAYDLVRRVVAPAPPAITTGSDQLRDLLASCSAVHHGYHPTPWLPSGHLQTARLPFVRSQPGPKDYYREVFEVEGGAAVFALDWSTYGIECGSGRRGRRRSSRGHVQIRSAPGLEEAPTLVILHGLTGGDPARKHVGASYVHSLVADAKARGWRAVILIARGTHGLHVRCATEWYSIGRTSDVRQAVEHVRACLPRSPLLGVGFSAGGNILSKYLGEEGSRTPLSAAATFANPFDLQVCFDVMNRRPLHSMLYGGAMVKNMKRELRRHCASFADHPGIDFAHVLRARTVREFQERFTILVFGYKTVEDYHRDVSCAHVLPAIRRPVAFFNAGDDPICPREAWPLALCASSGTCALVTTETGGHLGWFEGWAGVRTWMTRAASGFFAALLPTLPPPPPAPAAKLLSPSFLYGSESEGEEEGEEGEGEGEEEGAEEGGAGEEAGEEGSSLPLVPLASDWEEAEVINSPFHGPAPSPPAPPPLPLASPSA